MSPSATTPARQLRARLDPQSRGRARRRGGFSVQHSPGVVVRPRMVRVGILGKDDELARIVGPVAQRVKVERAPERCGCRRSFDAGQRIAVPHAPPSLHVDLHRSQHVPGDGTVHRNEAGIIRSNEGSGRAKAARLYSSNQRHAAHSDSSDGTKILSGAPTPSRSTSCLHTGFQITDPNRKQADPPIHPPGASGRERCSLSANAPDRPRASPMPRALSAGESASTHPRAPERRTPGATRRS